MPSRTISWFGLIACVAFPIWIPDMCNAQQATATIEQVIQVWKDRQDKVATARFEMSCEETLHKGSTSFLTSDQRRRAGLPPEQESNPPRDFLVTGASSVSLDGPKLRYTYDHQQWDPIGKKLHPEQYVDVFDGHLFKFLQIPASGQKEYPLAAVRQAGASQSSLKYPIIPLIFTFRGKHSQFFKDLDNFRVTGQTVAIGEHRCIELIKGPRPSNRLASREVLFLDQIRDYVVVKQMIVVDDKPDWQVDITYTPDAAVGWVPQSWEYIIRAGKDHRIVESGRRKVTRYEVNTPMEGKEFDISFPPKTRVHDESSGTYVQHVVREDGERGRSIPIVLNPTYEDLQMAAPLINRRWVWATWAMIFALGLGAWVWLRRRRLRGNC